MSSAQNYVVPPGWLQSCTGSHQGAFSCWCMVCNLGYINQAVHHNKLAPIFSTNDSQPLHLSDHVCKLSIFIAMITFRVNSPWLFGLSCAHHLQAALFSASERPHGSQEALHLPQVGEERDALFRSDLRVATLHQSAWTALCGFALHRGRLPHSLFGMGDGGFMPNSNTAKISACSGSNQGMCLRNTSRSWNPIKRFYLQTSNVTRTRRERKAAWIPMPKTGAPSRERMPGIGNAWANGDLQGLGRSSFPKTQPETWVSCGNYNRSGSNAFSPENHSKGEGPGNAP